MGKKRNKSSKSSDTGLTPPNKTTKMAATPPSNNQPTFSQVLGQAYESYLSPQSNLPINASLNQGFFNANPTNPNYQNMSQKK